MNKKVSQEKYISFDVFDTLIKRSVARPEDLFMWMTKIHGEDMNIPANFIDVRLKALKTASAMYRNAPTLMQIYDVIKESYGDISQEWMKLELQMEYDGIRPNTCCVDIFQRYIKDGIRIVLISDMYLPSTFIGKLLEKCGIIGYQKLYVSCEMGCTKRNGKLFKRVLEDLKIQPSQIEHIGDSKRGDFLMPLLLGIKVHHVKNYKIKFYRNGKFLSNKSALTYRTIQTIVKNCSHGMTEYAKEGCANFGPILSGYIYWLAQQLRRYDIHDVYFFSRDGWMLMRAFGELNITDIRAHYLYGSRRSYFVPTLWYNSQFSYVMNYLKRGPRISLSVFLIKLGLDPSDYKIQVKDMGLDLDYIYEHDTFWVDDNIKCFYESIRKDVIINSRKEYDSLVKYLSSLNLPNEIAVCDVGYRGTMQYALQEILNLAGMNINVRGFYLGLRSDSLYVRHKDIQAEGYLYDIGKNENYSELIISALYEIQFFKLEGSVKCFVINQGKAEPIFNQFEYSADRVNHVNETEVIEEYQEGAIAFVTELNSTFCQRYLDIEPDSAILNFFRLSYYPTLYEARLWGDFTISDGDLRVMARPNKIIYYFFHPKDLKNDFLYISTWKIGFMKRVFKIKFPYYKIYFKLKRCYNNQI